MKRSVARLPKRTQEELTVLSDLIRSTLKETCMVILYGSYARGNYVLWDEQIEFGVRTSYQSDYDLLVVLTKGSVQIAENTLFHKVTEAYHEAFAHRRHASPQFVVESIKDVNQYLERSQYFFTEIVRDGIMLYDNQKQILAKPRQLAFAEIKEIAQEEFNITYPSGCNFLRIGKQTSEQNMLNESAFILHQACEKFYATILLVFTNYRPKSHKLQTLHGMAKRFARELSAVFPLNTDFEKECFDLLCRAYIEARYNKNYRITREQIVYMAQCIEILREVTHRICNEKIASYDDYNTNSKV